MKKILSVCLVLSLVLVSVNAVAYTDTGDDAALIKAADELSELDVLNGYDDNTIRPQNNITRAETAQLLRNMLPPAYDSGMVIGDVGFADITAEHWGYDAVSLMSNLNILKGDGDGCVRPDDEITNAEVVTMLLRMLGYESRAEENGGYPEGYMLVAKETGLLENTNIMPNEIAIRRDIAVMVYNALDIPMMLATGYDAQMGKATYETESERTYRKSITEYVYNSL